MQLDILVRATKNKHDLLPRSLGQVRGRVGLRPSSSHRDGLFLPECSPKWMILSIFHA